MNEILLGALGMSLLHALLPNHWLPIVALGQRERWTFAQVMQTTLFAGAAHVVSTVLAGVLIAYLGKALAGVIEPFTLWAPPFLLLGMGVFFIYQHYFHHHFHVEAPKSNKGILMALVLSMFLSPCLEIEGFYLLAGLEGWQAVFWLSVIYAGISLLGMLVWVTLVYRGLQRFNWHRIEHNAGIISGILLIAAGILSFFVK